MDEKTLELVQELVDGKEGAEARLKEHLATPGILGSDLLEELLRHDHFRVRVLAVDATKGASEHLDQLLGSLRNDTARPVRLAAVSQLESNDDLRVLPFLVEALAQDDDEVCRAVARSIESRIVDVGWYPQDAKMPDVPTLRDAREALRRIGEGETPTLHDWLDDLAEHKINVPALAEFGIDLTTLAEKGELRRAYEVDPVLDALIGILESDGRRSAVLLGESGAGKTAIVDELVHRLRDPSRERPWRVIRLAPADFLVGTMWMGEWESKLQRLVNEARWPRRVLIYIPGLHELETVGRSSVSRTNVATMLAPHLESGAIAVLGESTPEEFAAGLGRKDSLRRLFEPIEVRPAPAERTRVILERVAEDESAAWSGDDLDRLCELADFYFAGAVQPGRAVGLLRRVFEAHPDAREAPTERVVLETISVSTGIPVELLDADRPLDLGAARAFFEQRVMGQGEAVDAVLDLVTLIKAGLTDPMKPIGVLFFVGPTGVGKTEMARSVAEFVFGDARRLVRFDMSEFATYDAFERLIGKDGNRGQLTSVAQEKPLSVILLDEIEKAHVNVFDLCLQIFDAGRLTDGRGRTADFRRSVVILTSNVGSVVPTEESFGFVRETRPPPDRETTLRDVYRFFRPEFLNRLDRIVVFKPLSPETAERIAQREIRRVVTRSGIARRSLAVDVDPSVIALLLRRGYSPSFGARPLKRTIERMVLLPIARKIAEGRAEKGSALRVTARGEHVTVTLFPPEGKSRTRPKPKEVKKAARIDERLSELEERHEGFDAFVAESVRSRGEALKEAEAPDFWSDREAALENMERIRRFDGLLTAIEKLGQRVRGLRASKRTDPEHVVEIIDRLERETARLEHLAFHCGPTGLTDALLTATLVQSADAGLEGVARIAGMYAAYARDRGFELEVIDDRRGNEDSVTLLIAGVGAYAILEGETGLHNVIRTVSGKNRPKRERDVVRVEVLPVAEGPQRPPADELKVDTTPVKGEPGRLGERPRTRVSVMHRPTMTSVTAWTPADREEALERILPLLIARMEGADRDPDQKADQVVRRYTLGPTPLVRDQRTGRTARLESVLEGDLELFLTPRES